MAEDALGSFTSLLESIPKILADLDRILKTTSTRQDESVFADQPTYSGTTSERPRKRSRISSLLSRRSIRSFQGARIEQLRPTLPRELLPQPSSDDTTRTSQRKRKATSICSGDHRAPPSTYLYRSMVVTYYDGDVQRQFEEIVRDIGARRIAIKKGRAGMKMDNLSRTSSNRSSSRGSSGGDSNSRSRRKVDDVAHEVTTAPPETMTPYDSTPEARPGVEAFDEVDGLMEQGQSLCEKAAFQVLRDGDCTVEITTARRRIVEAKAIAEAELPTLMLKAEAAAARKRETDARRRTRETQDEKLRKRRRLDNSPLAGLPMFASTVPGDFKLEVDELDEDSDSDDPEIFLRNRYQVPSPRLLVH